METVTLYRAMCGAEFVQLVLSHRFLLCPASVEGKYFAETAEHAAKWGRWFQEQTGEPHDRIVAVKLSADIVNAMVRFPLLDGIGPAYFATISQLPQPADIEVVR